MNRIVVFGVAMFFAIVGIALLGADNQADAGQRCCGCSGASCGGCGGCWGCHKCCGPRRCCGCMGAKRCCGCMGYRRCCGCAGPVNCCGCAGGMAPAAPAPAPGAEKTEVPPAPEAASTIERSPMVFHSVSFRR